MRYAFDPTQWTNIFLLLGGAAATLTGLVFVAVSIHLRTILGDPLLRNRARITFMALIAIVFWSTLALFPGQAASQLGWEVITVAGVFLFFFSYSMGHALQHRRGRVGVAIWVRAALATLTSFVLIASGISLIDGDGPGMVMLAVGQMFGLALAIQGTWSLFVGVALDER